LTQISCRIPAKKETVEDRSIQVFTEFNIAFCFHRKIQYYCPGLHLVFNATFNNITVTLWRSVSFQLISLYQADLVPPIRLTISSGDSNSLCLNLLARKPNLEKKILIFTCPNPV